MQIITVRQWGGQLYKGALKSLPGTTSRLWLACHKCLHDHIERLAKEKSDKLLANIEKGLSAKEYEFSMEEIDEKFSGLQKELMTLVRLNARTGLDASVYSEEYAKVSAEIELFRDRRQKLKEETAKDSLRIERIKELKVFLKDIDSVLERFDGELFGRLIEKVTVTSLVEVTFIFKIGIEVREILGL